MKTACSLFKIFCLKKKKNQVYHSEFKQLSLLCKGSLTALCLASKMGNSLKTSLYCCPVFCAVTVGIKIESFQNKVKVCQYIKPPN